MISQQVSKTEFKARALELFRQVESSGQSLIVTDHGKPTVEIKPYRDKSANGTAQRTPLELLRGSVISYENPMEPVGEDDWELSP